METGGNSYSGRSNVLSLSSGNFSYNTDLFPKQDASNNRVNSKEMFLLVECKFVPVLELDMLIIFLEALVAIVIVGAFIWWTMKGK